VKYAYLGLQKFYGSITSVPEAHFLTKRGRLLPPISPRFENYYLHPHLLNTPPLPLFCLLFFRNVTEPHELCNDTCFVSVMSRNFTNYATIPSSASGMLRNFTDCAIMFPFDSRHVAELHELLNDGCQVPRSGQAKVACHQTMVPRRN